LDDQRNVETLVVLQPIAVDTSSADRDGRLVLANGMLVGVLVHLDSPEHESNGGWFLEVGLGRLYGLRPPPFNTLEDATRWMRQRLKPRA
jgi:hypothetical protein